MKIPGCAIGFHSTEKDESETVAKKAIRKPIDPSEIVKPTDQYSTGREQVQVSNEVHEDDLAALVPNGTVCSRNSCGYIFKSVQVSRAPGSEADCLHHPGLPIFHEGSKGWTCCSSRVLEFDEFQKIKGCKSTLNHCFFPPKKVFKCRRSWYQNSEQLIMDVYAKVEETSNVIFQKTNILLCFQMKDGTSYEETINLTNEIVPENSKFKIYSTKIEITAQKYSKQNWNKL